MGLLDDAIREHLELKRLHGADPAEVAREERAALSGAADPPGPGPAHAIQETAELDMRTVLEAAESEEGAPAPKLDRESPAGHAATRARIDPPDVGAWAEGRAR
jgi:hypothetical protein